jgi:hypothetical protein
MLRWKRITTATLTDGQETLKTIISGQQGRKYKIKFISTAPLADMYLRVYKNADQIVDVASIAMTTAAPLLPMDLDVNVGDVIDAGFYNNGAATTAKQISIGYEDYT